jgi:hypothetical protein
MPLRQPPSWQEPDGYGQLMTLCAGGQQLEPVSVGSADAQSKEPELV